MERDRFEEMQLGFLEEYAIGEDMEMWTRMVGKSNKLESKEYNCPHKFQWLRAYKHIHEENTTEGGTQSYLNGNIQSEYRILRKNQLAEMLCQSI